MKITLPPLNDTREYNRKTTDYGNRSEERRVGKEC